MVKGASLRAEPAPADPEPSIPGDDRLGRLLAEARAEWPTVDLPRAVFAAYLDSHAPSEPGDLDPLHASDLYLACACARGDAQAIEAFERRCLSVVDEALTRMAGIEADAVDEVKQELRRRLLVADDRPPRIVEFSGRGRLRRWVRVLAVREALALRRRGRRLTPTGDSVLERALRPAIDPEAAYLKRLYQAEFTRAVAEAFRGLPAGDQVLLRQSFVDGKGIDELAALHRVHRATAARRLERARQALSESIHALLADRLRVESAELRSILRFLRSGLDLSMRLLRPRRRRPA